MFRVTALLVISLLLIACANSPKSKPPADSIAVMQAEVSADKQLTLLLDSHWQSVMDDYPEYASYLGMGTSRAMGGSCG